MYTVKYSFKKVKYRKWRRNCARTEQSGDYSLKIVVFGNSSYS